MGSNNISIDFFFIATMTFRSDGMGALPRRDKVSIWMQTCMQFEIDGLQEDQEFFWQAIAVIAFFFLAPVWGKKKT